MRYKPVLFAVSLLALPVWAVPSYVRPTDASVPKAVRESTKSVFRLVPRAEKPIEYEPEVMAVLLNSPDNFSKMQFQAAKKKSGRARYTQTRYLGYNSAFLMGNNQTLICTRHTWEEIFWKRWQDELSKIPDQEKRLDELVRRVIASRLEFDLLDSNGKNIFGSEAGDYGTLSFILTYRLFEELRGNPTPEGKPLELLNDPAFDFVSIKLSRPLTEFDGLRVAEHAPKTNEPLYGAGFPGNYDSNYSRPTSSDGLGLWVSKGLKLPASAGARALNMKDITDVEASDLFDNRLLFFGAEAGPGISGGPVLNENGQLVSVVTVGLWDGPASNNLPITGAPSHLLFKVGIERFGKLFEFE